MEKIRVVIVEDDINFLKAMTIFINNQQDMLVVSSATSKEQAVELAQVVQFDVILMDINLSENMCDGILATVEILKFSRPKIIMLTSLKENEIILDSFTAGAVNYIPKEKYRDIPDTIRAAFYNESPIEVLLNKFAELQKQEQLKKLTPCEVEVFGLLEQGYTKKMIENELIKSEHTIKTLVKRILRKLAVHSSKEAVDKVRTCGLRERLGK